MASALFEPVTRATAGPAPPQASRLHIYTPTIEGLARQLPDIGTGIADALAALSRQPTQARARQAAAQVAGAQAYLQRLQAALTREGGADGR